MTDRLGEALALLDEKGFAYLGVNDPISAAARAWHTLTTNPNYEAGRKVLWELSHDRYTDEHLQAVLDALTVTPTPEADSPNTPNL